jgi:hypothetical protein
MAFKLITGNPYDYNEVVKKAAYKKKNLPSPVYAHLDPNANFLGKFLGLTDRHDWGKNYPTVWDILEWSREKTKSDDINTIVKFLEEQLSNHPTLTGRRIDELSIIRRLDLMKDPKIKEEQKPEEEPQKVEIEISIKGANIKNELKEKEVKTNGKRSD